MTNDNNTFAASPSVSTRPANGNPVLSPPPAALWQHETSPEFNVNEANLNAGENLLIMLGAMHCSFTTPNGHPALPIMINHLLHHATAIQSALANLTENAINIDFNENPETAKITKANIAYGLQQLTMSSLLLSASMHHMSSETNSFRNEFLAMLAQFKKLAPDLVKQNSDELALSQPAAGTA